MAKSDRLPFRRVEMKIMETFEENPPNSPHHVREVLEAKLDFGSGEVPTLLAISIELLGMEKEKCGGVAAMKDCLNSFMVFPRMNLVPTVRDFEDFLFSPDLNSARIVQALDHPSTSQEVSPSVLGQIPGVTVNPTMQKTLKVKVYTGTGWKIDFPDLDGGKTPDLFVKLSILGLTTDERTVKTKVKKNCWTPSWGEEFAFPLCSPEDALLLVEVYDRDRFTRNDFAGTFSVPVSELRMGIHAVPLFDQKGVQCSAARLLMRFMFV